MATSGTISATIFNIGKIIDMAFYRCRIDPNYITSAMLDTAKDALYLIVSDLANQGSVSWCISNTTLPMVQGEKIVTCPQGAISVRHVMYVDNGFEVKLGRLSIDQYALLPNKNIQSRPNSYYIKRNQSNLDLYLWPVPDSIAATKTLSIWYTRNIMDITSLNEEIDVPQRWLEAIVAKLAFSLAIVSTEVKDQGLLSLLGASAQESMMNAWKGDSDGASISIMPNIRCYNA